MQLSIQLLQLREVGRKGQPVGLSTAFVARLTCSIDANATFMNAGKNSKKLSMIGYSALNLFVKPSTHEPISSKVEPEFTLNEGDFQIPIYSGVPSKKTKWSVSNLERG